jgi:hypothetical protein
MRDAIPEREAWSVPMPDIIADPPSLPCYFPVTGTGITQYQSLDPEFFLISRARERGRFATGLSGNPRERFAADR